MPQTIGFLQMMAVPVHDGVATIDALDGRRVTSPRWTRQVI